MQNAFVELAPFSKLIESAQKSVKFDADNVKAQYRLTLGFILLQKGIEAKKEFKNLQKIIEMHKDRNAFSAIIIELETKLKLLEENANGQFNWPELVKEFISTGGEPLKIELLTL